MCKELVTPVKMLCGHSVESQTTFVSDGCGCGTVLETVHCGETKKKVPCDDCQDSRMWVKNAANKWVKA